MTKYIFVTWWVCSSLWKWISAASIWAILKASWYKIFMQKLDPYLNIDPGTMSPFQHWEVFVTEDWAETDLDLWHYERFIDTNLSKFSSFTTWKIYSEVLDKERKWEYWGKTIQIIPHITDTIIKKIKWWAKHSKADFVIVEIWWTVWDIEWEPYLEAIRQMKFQLKNQQTLFVHLTLLPYLAWAKELKTKPTQLSVRDLKRVWISPDIILARSDKNIPKELLDNISMFCDVEKKAVIPAKTLDSIYKVPLEFEKYKISEVIFEKLWLEKRKPNMKIWEDLNEKLNEEKTEIKVWLAVKYNWLEDAYLSVIESLNFAWINQWKKIKIVRIDTEKIENKDNLELEKMKTCLWICVPWGFWKRWVEWKIEIAKYCRENNIPYLGLCLWSQVLAIEFARFSWIKNANSQEFDEKWEDKIFHYLAGQSDKSNIWWTLRLGSYDCKIKNWTKAFEVYWKNKINERHRHRYEFNNKYKEELEKKWLIISGTSPNWELMEILEIKNHKFMIWSQFHPEFKSRPYLPHPLFLSFIKAIIS